VSAEFAPDGSHLFAVCDKGRGMPFDVDPAAWTQHACRVAAREFTARTLKDVLADRRYRDIFPPG
jgi:hypothetical protein